MLRTISKKFSSKVVALEELDKIKTITLQGLVRILQTYQMSYLEIDQGISIALKSQFGFTNDNLDVLEIGFISKESQECYKKGEQRT